MKPPDRLAIARRAELINRGKSAVAEALAGALKGVLTKEKPDQVLEFAYQVEETVAAYGANYRPAAKERLGYVHELEVLLAACEAIRSAAIGAAAIGENAADRVDSMVWNTIGRPDPFAGFPAVQRRLKDLDSSLGPYAEAARRELDRARRPGAIPERARAALVWDIAEAYAKIFAKKPSAEERAFFYRAFQRISKFAKDCPGFPAIPEISRRALRDIIKDVRPPSLDPPLPEK
jgi:hypothetical protein